MTDPSCPNCGEIHEKPWELNWETIYEPGDSYDLAVVNCPDCKNDYVIKRWVIFEFETEKLGGTQ